MRILVYPNAMSIGGSQLNAIEIAVAVRDLGHEVLVAGGPGPLRARVEAAGLELIPLPERRRRPSLPVAASLRRLIRTRGLDVIHGYEWPPVLDATAAVFPGRRASAVGTVMSMAVAPFLPASMPLVVGTRALQVDTAARRPGPVYLIEPPVDTVDNAPGHDPATFRAAFGLDPGPLDVVVVSRLAPQLKLEGILTAVDVIGDLARDRPIRLIVVGGGPSTDVVARRAELANSRAGHRAVVLTGEILDPRPAYAAADVMLGMGGSALRALAFARPLIVQGERGFWELLTPESTEMFLHQGWYGVGDGVDGTGRLAGILRQIIDNPELRKTLSRYGRSLVTERFSLDRAARMQEEIYAEAAQRRAGVSRLVALRDAAGTLAGLVAHKARRRIESFRGEAARDDFNAVALARSASPRR